MALKSFRPVTAVLRYKTVSDFSGITKKAPEKSLLTSLSKNGGRNNDGHITIRHRGGGNRRKYRIIDFRRDKHDIPGIVSAIEYDPNRSARIALIIYKDGEKRYMLAPNNLQAGQTVMSGPGAEIAAGNAMPLSRIPLGTMVHNVEMRIGKGAQMARTAGAYAEVVAKEGKFVQLRLPSGEVRNVGKDCYATIGQVGNTDHQNVVIGGAGRKRHLGRRPHVRGMVMNPVDHPNGGGEGNSKSGGGWHHLCSPWGNMVKGQKTRKKNKKSDKLIIKRRKKSKRKK